MELEVRPASEVERFVAFARAHRGATHRALDVIASFSADNTRADVRVTQYD